MYKNFESARKFPGDFANFQDFQEGKIIPVYFQDFQELLDTLILNADKTELMWFGPAVKLKKIPSAISNIRVGSIDVQPVTVVRDLGVMIDAELSMREHVS